MEDGEADAYYGYAYRAQGRWECNRTKPQAATYASPFSLHPHTMPSSDSQAGITQQGVNVSRGLLSQRDMLEDALRQRAEVRRPLLVRLRPSPESARSLSPSPPRKSKPKSKPNQL